MNSGDLKLFKNQKQWALDFERENTRKPTKNDFQKYFNLPKSTIPHKDALPYMSNNRGSRLEEIVYDYVSMIYGGSVLRNQKIIPKDTRGNLEIDIFIPALKIGFEIQDFKTHSKEDDQEIGSFGKFKNGPQYHQNKKGLARNINIDLFEIWEDEIINATFKEKVASIINKNL